MAKRAAIYLRVSTDEQSTENQERALREIAARSPFPAAGRSFPSDQRAQVRVDLRPASKGGGFPTPVPAEAGSVRTMVSGRTIVMALRTDGTIDTGG
jgi:Resolvase, N terminal domain